MKKLPTFPIRRASGGSECSDRWNFKGLKSAERLVKSSERFAETPGVVSAANVKLIAVDKRRGGHQPAANRLNKRIFDPDRWHHVGIASSERCNSREPFDQNRAVGKAQVGELDRHPVTIQHSIEHARLFPCVKLIDDFDPPTEPLLSGWQQRAPDAHLTSIAATQSHRWLSASRPHRP